MVEQEAVNFEVAGSSPAVGAKHKHYDESHGVFVLRKVYVLCLFGYPENYGKVNLLTMRIFVL